MVGLPIITNIRIRTFGDRRPESHAHPDIQPNGHGYADIQPNGHGDANCPIGYADVTPLTDSRTATPTRPDSNCHSYRNANFDTYGHADCDSDANCNAHTYADSNSKRNTVCSTYGHDECGQ